MAPGYYTKMPAPEYHAHDSVTYGVLRAMKKCPAKAQMMLGRTGSGLPTDSQRLGLAIHCAILESNTFNSEYKAAACRGGEVSCKRKPIVCTRKHDWYCRLHARDINPYEIESNAPVTADEKELDICRSIRDSYYAHPAVKNVLDRPMESEVSLFWKDKNTSLDCKCRPDYLSEDGKIAIDLKTTRRSAHLINFSRHALKNGYIHQAAFTRMACRALNIPLYNYYLIALETSKPFCVAVYRIRIQDLEWAEKELRLGLTKLSNCMVSGKWPGYDIIQDIDIPEHLRDHEFCLKNH